MTSIVESINGGNIELRVEIPGDRSFRTMGTERCRGSIASSTTPSEEPVEDRRAIEKDRGPQNGHRTQISH